MKPKKYKSRPSTCEAMLFDGTNGEYIYKAFDCPSDLLAIANVISIITLNGWVWADVV